MTDILIAPPGAIASADPQAPQSLGWRRRLVRFGILGLVIAAIAVAAAVLPIQDIADGIAKLGPIAAAIIAVVGGLLLSVLVPRTAITVACGALLGATTGAATALAAAVIAAAVTYYAGRWVGRGALEARAGGKLGSKLHKLDGWLNKRGLSAVLLVRFLPLAPFGLVGYAYGTTSVCRKRYLLGTTLAAIPSAISYATIGAAVTQPGEMSVLSFAPAAIGFLLTTGIVVWWKRSAKKSAAAVATA
ncbi:VTT domain-containing protein [Actinoplanes sp. NPDC049596]|uniref:TVP38/TMEM64 family protein n=1 Tax=unclassified Actinoplanes TaxID=2626549 RepID=UPI0034407020